MLDRRREMVSRRHERLFLDDEMELDRSEKANDRSERAGARSERASDPDHLLFRFDRLLFRRDRLPGLADRILFRPRRSCSPRGKRSFLRRISPFLRFEAGTWSGKSVVIPTCRPGQRRQRATSSEDGPSADAFGWWVSSLHGGSHRSRAPIQTSPYRTPPSPPLRRQREPHASLLAVAMLLIILAVAVFMKRAG